MSQQIAYPIQFSVDYRDGRRNRLSSFFRVITVIPIAVVVWLVEPLILAPLVMLVFRHKYPRWWFDWEVAVLGFENRVFSYLLLLRDEYPSTDQEQAVHLEVPYPNVERELNRWLPLVKWLLALPHYVVLLLFAIALLVILIIAWFAILLTGRLPRGLFDFMVGTLRWLNRVSAYAFIFATDRYPPFRLAP